MEDVVINPPFWVPNMRVLAVVENLYISILRCHITLLWNEIPKIAVLGGFGSHKKPGHSHWVLGGSTVQNLLYEHIRKGNEVLNMLVPECDQVWFFWTMIYNIYVAILHHAAITQMVLCQYFETAFQYTRDFETAFQYTRDFETVTENGYILMPFLH